MSPRSAIDDGDDLCGFCLQLYVYELEVRCTCCDAAVCPMCAVVQTVTHLCPPCSSNGKQSADRLEEGAS